ncbi:hypothetical protein PHMEG_00030613, partial [Phytophthora megakarya]
MLWITAKVLGDVVYYVVRLRRRVVLHRIAIGLPSDDVHRVARDSYTYVVLSLLWMLRLESVDSPHTLISLDEDARTSLESLRTVLDSGETTSHAIITTGHIGFWEILPAALTPPVVPVQTQWIVYRPLHNAAINDLVTSIRSAPARRLIADKECYGLLHGVLQRPNSDGYGAQLVGLVTDQRCNSEHTRADVTFLGQPTRFATGAARLHVETGATLWFAAVLHNKRFYESSDPNEKPFRLVLRPMNSTSASNSKENVTEIVQTYASILEQLVDIARRSLRRVVLLRQSYLSTNYTCRLFSNVLSVNASNSDVSTRPISSSIEHQSLVTCVPNLEALQRVRWLLQQPQRRVLLLTGSSDSPARAALEQDAPAFELERRGHGIFSVREFCQLLLRESGRERRVFGHAQLAALVLHDGLMLPGANQLAAMSTLQRRKGVQDFLQLFRLLEREGVTPEQYKSAVEENGPQELVETYKNYQELLMQHNATSWDGLVSDVLALCGVQNGDATTKEFSQAVLKEYTDVVVDDVQKMTPAMATLVGHLCGQASVQSSASFSRVLQDGDECPRTQILERQLLKTSASTGPSVSRVALMQDDNSDKRVKMQAFANQVLIGENCGVSSPVP